jgi:hypothetical protein
MKDVPCFLINGQEIISEEMMPLEKPLAPRIMPLSTVTTMTRCYLLLKAPQKEGLMQAIGFKRLDCEAAS